MASSNFQQSPIYTEKQQLFNQADFLTQFTQLRQEVQEINSRLSAAPAYSPTQSILSSYPRAGIYQRLPPSQSSTQRWRENSYQPILYAALPVITATIWFSQMVYFLIYYLTLPRDPETHKRPKVSPAYSVWPFISCIGSVRMQYFQAFCSTTALFFMSSCFCDLYLNRDMTTAYWLRRAKAGASVITGVFLVALSFESVNSGNHLHLIFTSIQIWSASAVKLLGFLVEKAVAKQYQALKQDHVAKFSRRWKHFIAVFAGRK